MVCEVCQTNPTDKYWDTCLCGKRICFPCVKRRVTHFIDKKIEPKLEIRCGDACERKSTLG